MATAAFEREPWLSITPAGNTDQSLPAVRYHFKAKHSAQAQKRMPIMELKRSVCRNAPRIAINAKWRGHLLLLLVAMAAFLDVPSLRGHHGLAQFDTKHPMKLQGTVTEFQWINPHAYIYADVKDEHGKIRNWKLELGSLGMLTRFGGWTRDTVKRGDQITFDGFPAKDGSAYMSLITVQLSNGKMLSAAP